MKPWSTVLFVILVSSLGWLIVVAFAFAIAAFT